MARLSDARTLAGPFAICLLAALATTSDAAEADEPCAPHQPDSCEAAGSLASLPAATRPRLGAYQVRGVAEAGFLAALSNYGEFGDDASRIDFRKAAGQDNLLFYTRWSTELELGRRNTFVFLYQPLSTEGVRTPSVDERYEGVDFTAGEPVRTRFNFPFYRLSWLYELLGGEAGYLSLGLSGQLRNANYTFESLDGQAFARTSDVGFVPILKARGQLALGRSAFVGFEADGIYAPISVINGSTNETVGALLDTSVRAGVRVDDRSDVFLNVRYLGGGATNSDPADYAKNWLHFLFVGLGASLDLLPSPTRAR